MSGKQGTYERTPEIREKMSLSHIGRRLSQETKDKIREKITGTKRKRDSVERGSEKRRGEKHFHWGKPRTKEEKEKTSNSLIAFYKTEAGEKIKKSISERLSGTGRSKEEKRTYQMLHNRRKRLMLRELMEKLRSGGCVECGEKHPACLDWHHLDQGEKTTSISKIMTMGYERGVDFLMSESKKCIVLCANCHRKLHYENRTRGIKLNRPLTPVV